MNNVMSVLLLIVLFSYLTNITSTFAKDEVENLMNQISYIGKSGDRKVFKRRCRAIT